MKTKPICSVLIIMALALLTGCVTAPYHDY
jgi:hypothetical protein